jgi:hypothetical protein
LVHGGGALLVGLLGLGWLHELPIVRVETPWLSEVLLSKLLLLTLLEPTFFILFGGICALTRVIVLLIKQTHVVLVEVLAVLLELVILNDHGGQDARILTILMVLLGGLTVLVIGSRQVQVRNVCLRHGLAQGVGEQALVEHRHPIVRD